SLHFASSDKDQIADPNLCLSLYLSSFGNTRLVIRRTHQCDSSSYSIPPKIILNSMTVQPSFLHTATCNRLCNFFLLLFSARLWHDPYRCCAIKTGSVIDLHHFLNLIVVGLATVNHELEILIDAIMTHYVLQHCLHQRNLWLDSFRA